MPFWYTDFQQSPYHGRGTPPPYTMLKNPSYAIESDLNNFASSAKIDNIPIAFTGMNFMDFQYSLRSQSVPGFDFIR